MSEETVKYLVMQGGFAVLFLIAATVAGTLWRQIRETDKEHDAERAAWDVQKVAFFEARMAESLKVQSALEANTRALAALQSSSEARAATVAAMSQLIVHMAEKSDGRDSRYQAAWTRLDQRLEMVDRQTDATVRSLESINKSLDRNLLAIEGRR